MNHFKIIFGAGNNLYPSNFVYWVYKFDQNICYDEKVMDVYQKYGYLICGTYETRIYPIEYPKELKEDLVKQYLCAYSSGETESCYFKWKDYITDLLEDRTNSLAFIQQQMDLVKKINTKLYCQLEFMTSETRCALLKYHEEICIPRAQKYNRSAWCDCDHKFKQMTQVDTLNLQ